VHRDLKPANILFRADGRPVIVDFGLARDLEEPSSLTLAGQVLATPRYMSPEQCLAQHVDARSDLYSLGAVFYEMLTGGKIFGAQSAANLIDMHVNAPVPRLAPLLSGYQPILDKLLAKEPEERFQSARELFSLITT
jgi:serine/threonine-protein kinase PpkA